MIDRRVDVPASRNGGRTSAMERKKTGRPSKGARKQVNVRLPLPLVQAAHEQALQQGVTLNDFLGELLAEKTGVPYQHQGVLMAS